MVIFVDNESFYARIYETSVSTDNRNAVQSALWRFRTRVSLEHLLYSLNTKDHLLLSKFLQQVYMFKMYFY